MQRLPIQLSLSALLVVVAGVALNLWLFRFGALAGILGLSLTKHLAIAWLCQLLGVDRSDQSARVVEAGGPPEDPRRAGKTPPVSPVAGSGA